MEFSAQTRKQAIQQLGDEVFDLVIIGGGITGTGIARDAASRGMSVALIEAKDFASGTSSRSSKLIHGGIRYLENLEFHLVFEALAERRVLFEIAPTLVHPLRFVLPLFEGGRVGMFKLGAGMWLYDLLSLFEAPELHTRMSRAETLAKLPLLRRQGLKGAFAYHDGYMDDDLLVIETLRSAARQGAVCANFVSACDVQMENGKLRAVIAQDQLSKENIVLRGRHFVSTVGPWTDQLGQKLFSPWKKMLRPTKGVHLTLRRDRLHLEQALVMADDAKSRIVFAIPRHEMIILGTTDTGYEGDPGDVTTNADDVRYLLGIANEYFPGAKLTVEDFIASYAGVRPLVHDDAPTEGKTSREHMIVSDPRGITFVAGGKYTTYRRMAEQTVNAVLSQAPVEERVRFAHPNTQVALNDLTSESAVMRANLSLEQWQKDSGLNQQAIAMLAGHHAMETELLLNYQLPPWLAQASDQAKIFYFEACHALQNTMCLNLIDFYLRRTHLFLACEDHGLGVLDVVSRVFAEYYQWNDSQRRSQEAKVHAHIQKELGWKGQRFQ